MNGYQPAKPTSFTDHEVEAIRWYAREKNYVVLPGGGKLVKMRQLGSTFSKRLDDIVKEFDEAHPAEVVA